MADVLEDLQLRQVNTLDLPADKNKWPVTVTVQELDALIRVARAARRITWCLQEAANLNEALEHLDKLGETNG